MLSKLKKLLSTSVIALLLVAMNVSPIFAISESDRSAVNLDTVYYDPNSCDDSAGTSVAPTNSKTGVYLVGDKITSMSKTEIQKQVKGIVMSNDDFREVKNAVDVLNDDKDKVAKVGTVIIELGTWGRLDDGEIEKVIKKVKEINKDATIYWVDVIKGVSNVNADYNKKIYDGQSQGYKVISWFQTVYPDNDPQKDEGDLKDNKKLLDDDTGNVYPNEAGQKALASTIASTIGASGAVNAGASCGCGIGASVDVSAVAAGIPEPWRQLLAKVAAQYKTNPNFVAAIYMSENGNIWYPLSKTNWPVNPGSRAAGPMQFIPDTWNAYKADGDGDGTANINSLPDAMAATAKYAKALGVNADSQLGTLEKPLAKDTFLRGGASYNAGPGNVQKWGENAQLSTLYTETRNYVNNIYTLVKSNFTKSGHPNYGNPRTSGNVGGTVGQGGGGDTSASSGASCAQGGEVVGNVVFYSQIDPRWKNDAFGKTSSTIGSSGCGVTSFAMVAATLTGNNAITPKEISKLWGEKGWAIDGGTRWSAFDPNGAAKEYGLKAETIFANQGSHFNQNTIDKITAALRAGKLVIASGDHKTSTLFTGPHIIVIRGVTADGKFLVNDPKDDPKLKQQTSKQWDKSVLMAEAYGAWAFSK